MLKSYVAWFVIALFFLYQYILRVSPGVIVDELRREFQMTAEQFSTLGAYYLYAYSLFQIPLGLIVDRVGIRRTVSVSMIFCVLGAVLFGLAESLWLVQISRVLVGLGSAAAFMCALKFAVDFLPAGQRGFFMGATLTLGTVGALTAGKPLVFLVDAIGWRSALYVLAGFGLLILLLIQGFVPSHQGSKKAEVTRTFGAILFDVGQVLRHRQVMLYAMLAIGVYTPLSVLADLWGTAFLMEKYQLARADAAQISMMMYCGLAVSSLVLPWFCEKFQVINSGIQVCSLFLLGCFGFVLYGPVLSSLGLNLLLLCTGFCCGAEMVCFTGAAQSTSSQNSGVTLGVVNTLNMLGGAVLQQVIGYMLDRRWTGVVDAFGVRLYSVEDFSFALSLLLVVIGCCALASFQLARIHPNRPAMD